MKVALDLQPCCGNRSGIGTFTYEIAKRIACHHATEYCANIFDFFYHNQYAATINELKIPIHVCPLMAYGVYRRIWNHIAIPYEMLFQKADLNVFFDYIVPPNISGHVITTIYDMTYIRYPETMNIRNLQRIRNGISYSIERSEHIITISHFTKQEIMELLHVPEEKISIVPCASSLQQKFANPLQIQKKYSLRNPYLLYVGTIEPRKNLERLLRAFSVLKEHYHIPHQLVLAGGQGWGSESIYTLAKQLPCSADIIFTGYISDEEKCTLYRDASLFIFPSLYEGFGIPPLEAMKMDCPVVCSYAASLPEVVGNAARLVNPMDEKDIAEGMADVLFQKDVRSQLIEHGRIQRQKFTWDLAAAQFEQICKQVMEE